MDLIHSIHLPPWPSFAEVVAAYIARKRAGLRGDHEVGIQRMWPGQGSAGETKTFEINTGAAPWVPERDVLRRTAERVGIGNFPTDHELLWMIRDAEGVLRGDVEQRWEQREHNLFDVFEEAWYWWDIVESAAEEAGFELDEDGFLAKAILLIDAWFRSLSQPARSQDAAEALAALQAFRRQLPIYQTPGNLHYFFTRLLAVGHRPDTAIREIKFWTRVCEQVNARRGAHVRQIRDWFVARGNQRLLPRDRPQYHPMDTLGIRVFRVCLDAGEHHVHHLPGHADVTDASSPCQLILCAIVPRRSALPNFCLHGQIGPPMSSIRSVRRVWLRWSGNALISWWSRSRTALSLPRVPRQRLRLTLSRAS